MTNFKPMLFNNNPVRVKKGKLVIDCGKKGIIDAPKKDYVISPKVDGILSLCINGGLYSRSMKFLPNVQLAKYFIEPLEYSIRNNSILVGEIFSKELIFQEIVAVVMTQDMKIFETYQDVLDYYIAMKPKENSKDKKAIANWEVSKLRREEIEKIIKERDNPKIFLAIHLFDIIIDGKNEIPFIERLENLNNLSALKNVELLEQTLVKSEEIDKLEKLIEKHYDEGFEGSIIKSADGKYKNGRTSTNEGLGYKVKNFVHEDMLILDVIQATTVNPNAEKKINELGYSVTSKKIEDRIPIDMARKFLVRRFVEDDEGNIINEVDFEVSISETDEVKKEIWTNPKKYIGEKVEVKFMPIGMKNDVPRIASTVRMRFKENDE